MNNFMKNWMQKASTSIAPAVNPPASHSYVVTSADVHCDSEGTAVSSRPTVAGNIRQSKKRKRPEEPGIESLDCIDEGSVHAVGPTVPSSECSQPRLSEENEVDKSVDSVGKCLENEEETTVGKCLDTGKRIRVFPRKWLADHNWLRYDEAKKTMSCVICRKHGSGKFADGTQNFRVKTIIEHAQSSEHRRFLAGNDSNQQKVACGLHVMDARRRTAVVTALKSAYHVILEELPNTKYKSLMGFLRHMGLQGARDLMKARNATYDSPHIFNELLACLSEVLVNSLKVKLNNSKFIGIGIDESTDRAQEKHAAVIVRFVDQNGKVDTVFLSCQSIRDGTAASLLKAIQETLKLFDVPITKVLGLGADGASVVASDLNGVNGLMKQLNPFCVFVHCVCHRLNLAVSQACKKIESLKVISIIVGTVYGFVQQSSKRLQQFKDIAHLLNLECLKLKPLFDIRWLSMGECVLTLLRNFEPLVTLLIQESARGDPTAIGLLQQLTSCKYLGLIHLCADVLDSTNHLSRLLQRRDVSFSVLRTTIKSCIENLEGMKTNDGPYLSLFNAGLVCETMGEVTLTKFKGHALNVIAPRTRAGVALECDVNSSNSQSLNLNASFASAREEFLRVLLDNLKARFPHVDLLESMQIFEPAAYPADPANLVYWGNQHLEVLLRHYGQRRQNRAGSEFDAIVDSDCCRGEFLPFKRLLFQSRGEEKVTNGEMAFHFYSSTEIMEILFGQKNKSNRIIFPEIFKLMTACHCVLVGNSEAERVFSCQNRIKSKSRTNLTIAHLDQLIRLSHCKIPMEDFNFEAAADLFMVNERRL